MIKLLIYSLSLLICNICFGQIDALKYDSPVLWNKTDITQEKFHHIGIDTINSDTIKLISDAYFRINNKGFIIEELHLNPSTIKRMCNDDGYHLSGDWKSYYTSGKIKEMGMMTCNQKIGEWLYFYPNGNLKRKENYSIINDSSYLSGEFIEYYQNGKIKVSGIYKIIEKWSSYIMFDVKTYEEKTACCTWFPSATKYGKWKY